MIPRCCDDQEEERSLSDSGFRQFFLLCSSSLVFLAISNSLIAKSKLELFIAEANSAVSDDVGRAVNRCYWGFRLLPELFPALDHLL